MAHRTTRQGPRHLAQRRGSPLTWLNGTTWLPTPLARHVALQATGTTVDALRGTTWFADEDGRTLADLAEAVPGRAGRDWADLHAVLEAIPAGYWTTYGDLAQVVHTGAQAVGQHITHCVDCPNAHRVLNSTGQHAAGFKWDDPTRDDSPVDILIGEGLTFNNGTADPASCSPRPQGPLLENLSARQTVHRISMR